MKFINPLTATNSIKQLNMNVAPNAIFIPVLALCNFITSVLFNKIIRNNVIKGITNGLNACDAIKIQTGLPPKIGTIKPDKATKTTINLNKGLFMLRSVPV